MNFDYLHELTLLVPPPETPIYPLVREKFDSSLPIDYQEFLSIYGSGNFQHKKYYNFLTHLNFADPLYLSNSKALMDMLIDFKETEGEDYVPFDFYPKKDGVLVWGISDSQVFYFWQTNKRGPEHWEIVTSYDYSIITDFPTNTTQFMYELFTGKLDVTSFGWGQPDDRIDPSDIHFEPEAHRII